MERTLSLDADVEAMLRDEMASHGTTLSQTVNACLRRGLSPHQGRASPFVVKARPMGLRPGISLENIGKLLEQLDGLAHR